MGKLTIKYLAVKAGQILKWIGFLFLYLMGSTLIMGSGLTEYIGAETLLGEGLILTSLGLGFTWWRYHKQLQHSNPRSLGKQPLNKAKLLKFLGILLTLIIVQQVWQLLISHGMLTMPDNEKSVNAVINSNPFWNAISAIIVAPYFEELIFRGIFMNYFFNGASKQSQILAVLASGLLFGLAHEPALSFTLLFYSALGWILGFTYLYFKDLRYSIALHFINNLLSML